MLTFRDIKGTEAKDYAGVCQYKVGMDFADKYQLIVVDFEGTTELWLIDGVTGLKNLKAYYDRRWPGKSLPFQEFLPNESPKNFNQSKWFK